MKAKKPIHDFIHELQCEWKWKADMEVQDCKVKCRLWDVTEILGYVFIQPNISLSVWSWIQV